MIGFALSLCCALFAAISLWSEPHPPTPIPIVRAGLLIDGVLTDPETRSSGRREVLWLRERRHRHGADPTSSVVTQTRALRSPVLAAWTFTAGAVRTPRRIIRTPVAGALLPIVGLPVKPKRREARGGCSQVLRIEVRTSCAVASGRRILRRSGSATRCVVPGLRGGACPESWAR